MSETSPVVTGISVTFTATPDSGYSFVKWVDANDVSTTVSTENPYTTTINADTALKAIFEADTPVNYTVSATAGTGGTASVSPSGSVASGTSVTFTATPDSGYSFVKWVDANNESTEISTVNPYTATITADTALKAIFEADAPVSTTWPQEELAIVNSAKNSNLHYFAGSDSNTRVDNDFLNSTGSAQVSVALPFVIDDLSADVTYTVKIYAQGQGSPYAIVWDASGNERVSQSLKNSNWSALKSTPTTFTFAGSNFSAKGTYYAGIKANEYINFYKIEVTKSAPIGDKAEAVGPHKSGSVSLSGTTLTATPTNSRDFRFVGWYDNDECTGNALSTESTYTYNGTKVYAKFDYVAYNMPIIDIVTHDGNGNPHASFDAAWAGKSKSTKYKNSDIVIANTNYTLAETKVQIGGRGNSTWSLDKKPFQLKFGARVNLFNKGTAASKTWILLANHADRSLLRNQLALDFARSALNGIPFSSSTTPVEVYINGEYQGVYLVVEKSEVDTGRVNITTVSENTSNIDEIGFLAEWDKLAEDNNHVPQEDYYVKVTGIGGNSGYQLFTIKDGVPEGETLEGADRPSDATAASGSNSNDTARAIGNYLNDVSNTIMTGTQEQVAAKVDMNSLVDMFILQELTKNCDVGGSSFYVSKNAGAGSKLTFQPPWDFDRGFGNDQRGTNAGKLYINGSDDDDDANQNQWFQHLYKETNWFKPLVVARWNALRNNAATDPRTMLANTADSFASGYAASANRNFDKWQVLSASTGIYGEVSAPGSYANAVSGLKSWISDRLDYLDIEWQYEDPSIKTLTINRDPTIDGYNYAETDFDYDDNGTKNAKVIPFVVNDTTHDITVTMNFTGSSKWVNVFTPSGASLAGFQGSESNSKFDGVGTKYYVKTDGSFTFKIPAGSPTGTYYAAVTNPESYTSVTAKFTDDQAVTPYGSVAAFTVTFTATTGGTVSATVDGEPIKSGDEFVKNTTVTFTATANDGYVFDKWSDGNTKATRNVIVTKNIDLNAIFKDPTQVYSIEITPDDITANNGSMKRVNNSWKIDGSGEGSITSRSFYVYEDAKVTLDLTAWVSASSNYADFKLVDVTNGSTEIDKTELVHDDQKKTYTYTFDLPAGEYKFNMYGKDYDTFYSAVFSTEKPNILGFDEPVGEKIEPAPIVRVNNEAYGSVTKTVTSEPTTYYVGETITPVANTGYKFANWTIMDSDGSNKTIVSTKNLDLTADMAGKIVMANFGAIQKLRFEAESFVNFVSEGFVKVTNTTNKEAGKYSNSEYFVGSDNGKGGTLTNGYDAPKVVIDGNTDDKTQLWDGANYKALKIAPAYSNGEAVALTGPSSAIAVPLTLTEDLTDDTTINLGYNFGDMPTQYRSEDGTPYDEGKAVYVNLYSTANVKAIDGAMKAAGWKVSGRAKPDYASDLMLKNSDVDGDGNSDLQTAYYYELPKQAERTGTKVDGTTLASGTDETGRDTCQETSIVLPAGLPAGRYYISVATDGSNVFNGGSNWRHYDTSNAIDYTYTDNVGTAYYDYIEFEMVSTPDSPSPITVGAKFIFTDKWGNDLMTNAMSRSSYDPETGHISFNPSAPRYLVAQGYNIVGWTISEYDNDVGDFVPMDEFTFRYNDVDYTTDANGYVQLNENSEYAYDQATQRSSIDLGCDFIGSAAFPSGSTIKFKAEYAVAVAPKTVTITHGKIYRKSSNSDTELRSLIADGTNTAKSIQVPNFGEIRLEPSFEQAGAVFSYWTLNGMIYSFDADIHFSAWTDTADFTAHTNEDNSNPTNPTAVAFIDNTARTSGFETDDTSYHKITYDCAFYVPSGSTYVSAGLVYSNDKAAVKAATVSVSDSGAVSATTTTGKVLTTTVKSNLLLGGPDSNILNRQVMVSISGMKKSQSAAASGNSIYRSAMAYLVYRDGSGYHVVTSPNVVTAEAAVNPNSSSENR